MSKEKPRLRRGGKVRPLPGSRVTHSYTQGAGVPLAGSSAKGILAQPRGGLLVRRASASHLATIRYKEV